MIEINAIEERPVKVRLSERQIAQEAIRLLRVKYDLPQDSFLEEGQVATSAGRNHVTMHGIATKGQRNAFRAIDILSRSFGT